MTLRVKISARAAAEVRRAAEWWSANRPAAPGAIGADFAEAVALLAEQPGIGAKYVGSRTPSVRRLFLSRVGYFIYYMVEDADLKVLAFWRGSECSAPQDARRDLHPAYACVHRLWRNAALIKALGGEVFEREGSRVKIELEGHQRRCHRPHPGKKAKRYQVEEARELLERAGVSP